MVQWNDTDVARFESQVDRTGVCHLWTGGKTGAGYGAFYVNGQQVGAHVFAYLLAHGPDSIPIGMFVLHNCPDGDNPGCVNDAHLWRGTHAENMADRDAKGRAATGDRNGSRTHPELLPRGEASFSRTHPERIARGERINTAKLTEQAVREIRASTLSARRLAKLLGVSSVAVDNIRKGKSWKHVA